MRLQIGELTQKNHFKGGADMFTFQKARNRRGDVIQLILTCSLALLPRGLTLIEATMCKPACWVCAKQANSVKLAAGNR